MTLEQRKISLIQWITELKDEPLLYQIEDVRNGCLTELPREIVELLEKSDTATKAECVEHTNSRTILGKQ